VSTFNFFFWGALLSSKTHFGGKNVNLVQTTPFGAENGLSGVDVIFHKFYIPSACKLRRKAKLL